MATNLKQLTQNEELLCGGHRACAGCTGSNILRQIMLTAGKDTVVGGATGCMEVVTTIFPYIAQTTPYHWKDLAMKVEKALATDGPAFLNLLMPCTPGWHFDPAIGIDLAREAVECNFWPIFEVENGVYKINKKPKDKMPVADWMKKQGRFKHLFKPGNEHVLESTQAFVDKEWEKLLKLEESAS